VPVVQLSINALEPLEYHLDLGRRLAPLREHGVLVLASGNLVHNLRSIAWDTPTEGFDWARRFDDDLREVLQATPGDLLRLAEHGDYPLAVPTPDHFIPLLHLAALAEAEGAEPQVLVDGFTYGSISMTSYAVGAACIAASGASTTIPPPPTDPVPPEQSNI
jgi:4,5-DOPA dioxygenase extradiol